MKRSIVTVCLTLGLCSFAKGFDVITLGSDGGVVDGNISGYLVKGKNDSNYIGLDAGTILPGIKESLEKGSFENISIPEDSEWTDVGYIFREKIKGYLISHAHLDHVSGLVISSTEDTKKNIYGLKNTIDTFKGSIFNWKLWPNFGNEGEGFKLNQYTYVELVPNEKYSLKDTNLNVEAYSLSHSNYESTMFLIEDNGTYLAYYGDVGPDEVEKTDRLEKTFEALGALIKEKKLKGIMIESSYDSSRDDKALFGHLTPNWINKSLDSLAKYGGEKNIEGLNVIVTHIKPSLKKNDDIRKRVEKELRDNNKYKVNYYFPQQGDLIKLK
nr:3',5'-cyclic-nucleotide phosphodiesterase [uncultured Cetobacterium sp.]